MCTFTIEPTIINRKDLFFLFHDHYNVSIRLRDQDIDIGFFSLKDN